MKKINMLLKRIFDIILSSIAIIILLPILIVISIVIKIDSKGPIFFKQERRTVKGKIFQIFKYRTMVINAENIGSGLFNYKNDPRVTKIGKILRNSSLDELPQLFNILIGDMSIVGPRPSVKNELGDFATLNSKYKKRFEVKAGLTGLAQIKGRNNISWDQKVSFDNDYVDLFIKYGILIDFKIIIKSFFKVFKKEDIYEKEEKDLDEIESARVAENEIIRIAHLPDLIEDAKVKNKGEKNEKRCKR